MVKRGTKVGWRPDRAVAARAGNSDVVTHREGIYSLVRKWGLNGKRYDGHPYCCIGVFEAQLPDGHDHCQQWIFQRVKPYECFDKRHIPSREEIITNGSESEETKIDIPVSSKVFSK